MIIPCPSCSTKFKIEDRIFGDKKIIKFQCSKCKTLFRFDRVSGSAWLMDEEKTLPAIPMRDLDAAAPAPAPVRAPAPAPVEPPPEKGRKEEGEERDLEAATGIFKPSKMQDQYESFEPARPAAPEFEDETPASQKVEITPPPVRVQPPPAVSAQVEPAPIEESPLDVAQIDASPPAPVGDVDESTPPQFGAISYPPVEAPVIREPEAPPKTTIPPARPTGRRQILASDLYILELEYELQEKAQKQSSARAKAVGVTAIVVLLIIVGLYLFITWKNDWNFAALFTQPEDAFAIAVGEKTLLEIAPDAEGLETAVTEIFATDTANGVRILVVQGEVMNTTVFPKKQIRVYIQVMTRGEQPVAAFETVAGITLLTRPQIEEKTIAGLNMYADSERKTADEWVVNSGRKASFQAYIADAPSGAEDPNQYTLEATAISAVNAITDGSKF
jgi:predicted Zn finger-like uncharacterized protein